MENGYNINIVEECDSAFTRVYLEPQCGHPRHRRKLGYLEDDGTFHSTDDSLMSLEVMTHLTYAWSIYKKSKEEKLEEV